MDTSARKHLPPTLFKPVDGAGLAVDQYAGLGCVLRGDGMTRKAKETAELISLGERMTIIYMVGDSHTDIYGFFSTRALAEAYIQRQRSLKYPWWDGLVIIEWSLDEIRDLCK